jgi:hypothetical protein
MVLLGIVWKKFACFFTALRCFCNAKGAEASQRAQGLRVLCEGRTVTSLEGLTAASGDLAQRLRKGREAFAPSAKPPRPLR